MKKLLVFGVGVCLIGAAAWSWMPKSAGGSGGRDVPVVRLRIEQPGLSSDAQQRFLAEETLVITGPELLDAAIQRGRLDLLPTLKDADARQRLASALTAEPWQESTRILELQIDGFPETDGSAILRAVAEAYVERRGPSEQTLQLQTLQDDIRQLASQCVVTLEAQTEQHKKLVGEAKFPVLDDYDEALKARSEAVSERTRLVTQKEIEAAAVRSRVTVIEEAAEQNDQEALLALFGLDDKGATQQVNTAQITKTLLPLYMSRQQLLSKVGRDHPDVVKVNRDIAAAHELLGLSGDPADTSLWDFMKTYVQSLRMTQRAVELELETLNAELDKAQAELLEYSQFAVRERQLREAVATTKRQFELLDAKISEIKIAPPVEVEIVAGPAPRSSLKSSSLVPWLLGLIGLSTCGAAWLLGVPSRSKDTAPALERPLRVSPHLAGEQSGEFNAASSRELRQLAMVLQLARFSEDRTVVRIHGPAAASRRLAAATAEALRTCGLTADIEGAPTEPPLVDQRHVSQRGTNDFVFVMGAAAAECDELRQINLVLDESLTEPLRGCQVEDHDWPGDSVESADAGQLEPVHSS